MLIDYHQCNIAVVYLGMKVTQLDYKNTWELL